MEAREIETGEMVLTGECEVDQPVSAYVFTGQGSQRKGVGTDLRDRSPVARAVWDRADNYFMETFGFSLTHIVKNDAEELTIHFGCPKGKKIRQNYMALTQDFTLHDGTTITTRLLSERTPRSTSYTFRSPIGLLSATQFTQPALTLMEIALFGDMSYHPKALSFPTLLLPVIRLESILHLQHLVVASFQSKFLLPLPSSVALRCSSTLTTMRTAAPIIQCVRSTQARSLAATKLAYGTWSSALGSKPAG